MRPKPLIPTRTVMSDNLPSWVRHPGWAPRRRLPRLSPNLPNRPGFRRVGAGPSVLEHVGGETGLRAVDPQLLGPLVGHRQQPPDASGHRVLGHRRIGELTQLLEAGLLVLDPQLTGDAQVV